MRDASCVIIGSYIDLLKKHGLLGVFMTTVCPVCLESYDKLLMVALECAHLVCDSCANELYAYGHKRLEQNVRYGTVSTYFVCPYRCPESELIVHSDVIQGSDGQNSRNGLRCTHLTKVCCVLCGCLVTLGSTIFVLGKTVLSEPPPSGG